jgi:amino acid transporter
VTVNEGLTLPAPAPPAADGARPGLVRAIGRFDLTAAVVNAVIGSAIFGMPARQAALTGAWSPLAYLVAGVGILAVVLCFAEVASRFQDAGGPYLYTRESFGPFVGFQSGWLTFWIRVTAVSANLNVFATYLGELWPGAHTSLGRAFVMAVVVLLVAGFNVIGVRQATWKVDFFTVAKLLPLLLLIAFGLPRVSGDVLATQRVAEPDWTHAVLLLMFAYGGFEAPLIPAGEARRPRRDTAFALLVALALIAFVYMAVQLVVVGVVPGVASSRAPLADAFRLLLGPAGATLAALAAMTSIYGYATGSALQSPRVLYAMSERGELPALFARVHPRFHTPVAAIVTYAALVFALALYGDFEWNARLSAIVRLVTYGLVCASLLVLRRRRPGEAPGFRLPGAVFIAPAGALFCLGLLATRSFEQVWVLGLFVLAGVALWAGNRKTSNRQTSNRETSNKKAS